MLVQNEIPLATTIQCLVRASSLGIVTVFNPSPMLHATEFAEFPWSALSWLIVNEGELVEIRQHLSPLHSEMPAVTEVVKDLHGSAAFSRRIGIICTMGPRGAVYMRPGERQEPQHLAACALQKPVVDTTGAGDCFAGSFVAGLMRGADVREALDFSLAVSLLSLFWHWRLTCRRPQCV